MCRVISAAAAGGGGDGAVHQTNLYLQRLLGLTFLIIYFIQYTVIKRRAISVRYAKYF